MWDPIAPATTTITIHHEHHDADTILATIEAVGADLRARWGANVGPITITEPPTVPATGGTGTGHVQAVASCSACIANGLTGCAS